MSAGTACRQLMGTGVSPGFAAGNAYVHRDIMKEEYARYSVSEHEVQAEFARVERAFRDVLRDLVALAERVDHTIGRDYANIIRADAAVLRDPSVLEKIRVELETERLNAEEIVKRVFQREREKLYALENTVLRERGDDIGGLCKRVLRSLMGAHHALRRLAPNTILVVERLSPMEVAALEKKSVSAIVVELCGVTSHAAIFARGAGIPIASQIVDATTAIETGDELLVDGIAGRVLIAPDDGQRVRFESLRRQYVEAMVKAQESCMQPAVTRDGVHVRVMANVGNAEEVTLAAKSGADGIGLYRLEQLYARQEKLPSEDDLLSCLRKDLVDLKGKQITIRLLDTGGDKQLPYLDYPHEMNSMLGRRGVRLLLDCPALLSSQLNALVRLSRDFQIRILVPMVTIAEDMKTVRVALVDAARKLDCEAIPPLGAMIETPAAALCAAEISEWSDFLSIGTNDLTQYVMAAERDTSVVSRYYRDDHPAVLRLIRQTCEAVSRENVEVCGELAGNPKMIPILLQMGIRQFSVFALRVPAIKEIVRSSEAHQGLCTKRQ
jgi:phosphoenolpyruvate-protein phosphotransferase